MTEKASSFRQIVIQDWINWPAELSRMETAVTGPEDEPDPSVNGDIDSTVGEEDESGYDEMPLMNGWEDESDEDDGEEDEDDA